MKKVCVKTTFKEIADDNLEEKSLYTVLLCSVAL
jgi:hypothetical protein